MYRLILTHLQETVGPKAPYVLVGGGMLLVLAVILLCLPPWRRAVKAAQERGGWRGILMGTLSALLVLLVAGTIVEALRGSLLYQSNQFDQSHGRVSQTNYEAVKTNMGPPHEQHELRVTHYVTEEKTVFQYKDGRQVPLEEIQTLSEEDASDENSGGLALPNGPTEGKASGNEKAVERPIKRKIKVRKPVPENPIVRGEVSVDVRMNYRQKGSAYYTCYEDTWKFDYLVKNRSTKETEAEFRFPMPADQGFYNQFTILVDGKNWADSLVYKDNAQTWTLPMKPDQEVRVAVQYSSRGMEHLRYMLANMAHREDYKVTMRIYPNTKQDDEPARGEQQFFWKKHMGLPIGAMTPHVIKDAAAPGEPIVLEWNLKSAATTLGMGVILPKIPQPGYYCARLLHDAPGGLILLVAALVVSWMLLGRETDLFAFALLAVAYYLFYTLAAYLSDPIDSFTACFVLAALATLALSALFLWCGWGRNYAAHQTLALMAVFTIYYPLAITLDEYTGVMVQVLYWAMAVYAAILAVARLRRMRQATA